MLLSSIIPNRYESFSHKEECNERSGQRPQKQLSPENIMKAKKPLV